MPVCEICKQEFPSCDHHHIRSRSKGGGNAKWNIICICPNCHRLVHEGNIIIEGKFMTTNGYTVVWREKNKDSITNVQDPEVFIHKEN